VLEHLCWLADEMGESEIVCPIVEYASQLIPQLKHKLRSSKVSSRSSIGGHESDSNSDDSGDYTPSRLPPAAQGVNAVRTSVSSTPDASPRMQAPGSPAHSKMNFGSVMQAMRLESAKSASQTPLSAVGVGSKQIKPFDVSTAAHRAHPHTKSAVLAVLAAQNLKHAGEAAAAARMSERMLDSMKVDLARSGGGAQAAATPAIGRGKPAGLLAILAASAFRNAGSPRTASRLTNNVLQAMKQDLAASEAADIELQEVHGAAVPAAAAADAGDIELEVRTCAWQAWFVRAACWL